MDEKMNDSNVVSDRGKLWILYFVIKYLPNMWNGIVSAEVGLRLAKMHIENSRKTEKFY